MRVLIISPFMYMGSSSHGGATVCLNALEQLKEEHIVGMLCFQDVGAGDNSVLEKVQMEYFGTVPLRVGKAKVLYAKILSLVFGVPEHATYYKSTYFSQSIKKALLSFLPDIVICQFPQMAQYIPEIVDGNIPVVQDVQDAYSVSWYRRSKTAGNPIKRLYATREWLNWVRYERNFYSKATLCWTLSEQDRYGLLAFNPALKVHSIGLPLVEKIEKSTFPLAQNKFLVGFIGSFGHPPNREALSYLLSEIVARVTDVMPQVIFEIAGKAPPADLQRLAPSNVEFLGYVENLADFYGRCSVVVAPLLSGGGVKVKVAEALSYGKPVVTTSIGAEGMPVDSGVHLYIKDDPLGFSQAVIKLIQSEGERMRVSQAASKLALDLFSAKKWAFNANKLLSLASRRNSHL